MITLNDRRQYTEFDARRLNLLLIEHQEQADQVRDICQNLTAAIPEQSMRANPVEGRAFEDMFTDDIAQYTEQVNLVRLLHYGAWLWLQLAIRHQDELLMNGFGWSDAERYARRHVLTTTVSEQLYRTQAVNLGLCIDTEVYQT